MNSFYQLACALVAWSALSLTAEAAAAKALSALPQDAFQPSPVAPDRFIYLKPGVDLHAYHGVLIEPLALLSKNQGDWTLQVAAEQSLAQHHYRTRLAEALRQYGIHVVSAPEAGILRLRSALDVSELNRSDQTRNALLPAHASFNLEHMISGVGRYMAWIAGITQVEDALSGGLLAGSVDFKDEQPPAPAPQSTLASLTHRLDGWAEAKATRIARAIGQG